MFQLVSVAATLAAAAVCLEKRVADQGHLIKITTIAAVAIFGD